MRLTLRSDVRFNSSTRALQPSSTPGVGRGYVPMPTFGRHNQGREDSAEEALSTRPTPSIQG